MRTLPIIDSRDPRYDQKPEVLSGCVVIPKDENLDEEIEVAFEYTDGYWITITDVLTELNEDQKESFRFQVKEMFYNRTVDFQKTL